MKYRPELETLEARSLLSVAPLPVVSVPPSYASVVVQIDGHSVYTQLFGPGTLDYTHGSEDYLKQMAAPPAAPAILPDFSNVPAQIAVPPALPQGVSLADYTRESPATLEWIDEQFAAVLLSAKK